MDAGDRLERELAVEVVMAMGVRGEELQILLFSQKSVGLGMVHRFRG
jgi:hypothetical protein